jgi:hypothetical protein
MLYERLRRCLYERIAWRINAVSRYADRVILYKEDPGVPDTLEDLLETRKIKQCLALPEKLRDAPDHEVCHVVFNGTFNLTYDIQSILSAIKPHLLRQDRVSVVLYNPYLRFVFHLLDRMGLRKQRAMTTFVTAVDLRDLARITGYEVVRMRPTAFLLTRWWGMAKWADGFLGCLPLVRWLSWAWVAMLRPIVSDPTRPSLSIIIPARNEKGNIEGAITRLPREVLGALELIFVEGHSSDGTWEEILRVQQKYGDSISIKALKQTGAGKCDAVRLGAREATQDLLTILDADLTMPPELLGRFYWAFVEGHGDFINGSRLVYPMEGSAMRFLNYLGNVFFAKALSVALDARLGDSLCGTKLFSRRDYERMVAWRVRFGDFDPFGDFELLFPAAILGLGIVNVPIRYRARTYGTTNIRRFRHGLQLLKMTWVGFLRIKIGS